MKLRVLQKKRRDVFFTADSLNKTKKPGKADNTSYRKGKLKEIGKLGGNSRNPSTPVV